MKNSPSIISAPPAEPFPAEGFDDGPQAAHEEEVREVGVGAAQHGERLDRALAVLVPEFSRSYLQQLVDAGAVRLAGREVRKPAQRVKAGERLAVTLRPTPQSQAFRPEPMVLDVLHEDAHLLVLNKPAGLVVHPAPGNWSGTLLNGLLARDPQAVLLPRAGIVHRLDKDTSGLMVVARTRAVMDALVRMIAAREVSRQYVTLAHRAWSGPRTRRVDAAVGRDPRNRLRMAVVDPLQHPGKPATTDVAWLADAAPAVGCWVRCVLHTGRTHQIRVHMASIGHPLVADALYGGAPAAGLARQALHAFRLAFAHPATGEPMDLRAPLPADLVQALQAWSIAPEVPQPA